MLRPLVLALASGLLVVACALVDPPPPAGTVMLQISVNNQSGLPIDVAVTSGVGSTAMAGDARPPTVPARTRGDVQFFVPMGRPWAIRVNGQDLIIDSDVKGRTGVINDIGIDVDEHGNTGWWCQARCP